MPRQKKQSKKTVLVIEDGRTFQGTSFGAEGEALGEVVFNTSMTGYQEILCDPSYNGQLVTMTYPHIGNTGINPTDIESGKVQVGGFIVRECTRHHSNWRTTSSLDDYLSDAGVVGIDGIDTRALTLHIREKGAMKGIISTVDFNYETLMNKLYKYPGLVGQDLVKNVTTEKSYLWTAGAEVEDIFAYYEYTVGRAGEMLEQHEKSVDDAFYVVAIDCGIKYNILRMLSFFGCKVIVVPASYTSSQIMSLNPDGLFISNGPGDPEGVPYLIETIRELMDRQPDLPVFGICLGQQLLALAYGGKTYKLKFGHRGANHPVKDLASGKIEITTQNHGFCVTGSQDEDGLWKLDDCPELEVTHVNLNDMTIEGFRHRTNPVFSVQYHPEASAGPHDSWYLFQRFIDNIAARKRQLEQAEATPA
ncbi:MAG: glutamine-hydrolyzing carbamoyl-phosphate synthase small subunit [Candidatus Glassbacteria bacterium]|nr:glutamine-hydrolyzing carbamoyl-phosphate synthase small subunit [Candidatus Glassbacteria bacterium]